MKASRGTRSGRVVAVVAVAATSLVAFASLGGVGLAQSAVGLAQYQYGKKVTICHKGKRTIRISIRAWPAHKRHGDTQGACTLAVRHGKKHHEAHHAERSHGKKVERVRVVRVERAHGKKVERAHGKKVERAHEAAAQSSEGRGNGKGHDQ